MTLPLQNKVAKEATTSPLEIVDDNSFETSKSITKIAKALVEAQKNMGSAVKGANNPYFNSKYADLNSVLNACKTELNEQGIIILQPVLSNNDVNYVSTILMHESGEYISSKVKLIIQKNDMQQLGSAISYARRYSLQSLISLPSSDDDDGEGAVGRGSTKKNESQSSSEIKNRRQRFRKPKTENKKKAEENDEI